MLQRLREGLEKTEILRQLVIWEGESVWKLSIDVLVMDELYDSQLSPASIAIHFALSDLWLPKVVATLNKHTNELELDLKEQIYQDDQEADELLSLDTTEFPVFIEIGTYKDLTVLDMTRDEWQSMDSICNISINKTKRIFSMSTVVGKLQWWDMNRVMEEA